MATERTELFIKATLDICRNLEAHEALRACLTHLRGALPVDSMYLQVYEHDLGAMRVIARATTAASQPMDVHVAIPEDARRVFESNLDRTTADGMDRTAIINDPPDNSASQTILSAMNEPTSSVLVMMLVLDDAPFGSIVCVAHGTGRYRDEHRDALEMLYEPFLIALSNSLAHREVRRLRDMLVDDNRYLQEELDHVAGESIIGAEFGLKPVMDMVRQVARHESPVLVTGETGTGKDLVATAIHRMSPRNDAPFIRVNCGAIPESLVDSELFGHEKGAFTGAIARKRGRFERANSGTIFLDEIGDLPPEAQVRLLRVLQNREIERVGGTETIPVDARVIAATNRDLREMVTAGTFREDLFFRLCVFPIEVPPLRERRQDIPALVHHFVTRKCQELKHPQKPSLGEGEIDSLINYHWPGNVRELENVVERALILHEGGQLSFHGVVTSPQTLDENMPIASGSRELDAVISAHIEEVLEETGGRIHGSGGAAEILGVNPSTLRNKILRLGIHRPESRKVP